jgi:hydrogenase maturation protein HypF
LFDGVAALLGVRRSVSFEGQAAMELEGQVKETSGKSFPFEIQRDADGCFILDMSATIRAIVEEVLQGKSKKEIASSFHSTLAAAFVAMVRQINIITGLNRVALSGGCFQNRILLEKSIAGLEGAGFVVYCHKQVPANDGGIALGQAVVAGAKVKSGKG